MSRMKGGVALFVALLLSACAVTPPVPSNSATHEVAKALVPGTVKIICAANGSEGTGFLHKSGAVVTNWHVVGREE